MPSSTDASKEATVIAALEGQSLKKEKTKKAPKQKAEPKIKDIAGQLSFRKFPMPIVHKIKLKL